MARGKHQMVLGKVPGMAFNIYGVNMIGVQKCITCVCMVSFGLVLGVTQGGQETVEREPLVVEAPPLTVTVDGSGSTGAGDILKQIPEVDLQVQGIPGGQSDISIQGSSFSGAGIALQGLALPHAQTEHFHAELPFAVEWFGAPSVLTGFDQSVGSGGFLVGTLDFGILPVTTRRLLHGGVSEYDSYWGQLLVQERLQKGDHAVGVGAFAGAANINRVDFPDNDVEVRRAGAQLQWINAEGDQVDLLFGRQEKTLGVRGYYGVNPNWPGEEEISDTMIYLGAHRTRSSGTIRAGAYHRSFTDDYRLFWTLPGIFENNHRLETFGAMLDGQWVITDDYWLDWRITGREERIRSSALGYHERHHVAVSGIPGVRVGDWQYQLGARAEVFEDDDDVVLPQAAITYFLQSGMSVQLAYSESVRQPSFTELNYASPASLGNAGLGNQEAATTELTVRGAFAQNIDWKAGVFYRETSDTVDWIRRTEDSARWEAENIGTIRTVGWEAGGSWYHENGSSVGVYYLGLDQSDHSEVYSSRYALDYAAHLLRFTGRAAVGDLLTLGYDQTVRQQASNPLREGGRHQYDGSIYSTYRLRSQPEVLLTVAVDNIWDDAYQTFPGQDTFAGRRVSAGLRAEW